jgi:hypothetical protein
MATTKKEAQPENAPAVDATDSEPIEAHDAGKNLFQRIHAIMNDVRRLQKDKQVGSGGYAYKAVSEESVVTHIRKAMLRHGVVMFPIEQQHRLDDHVRADRNGASTIVSMSTVDVRYKLANVDDMSQYEIIASSGTGVDPQDKGVGKAMTYSFKYALLRTFMIPTGADPDDVHNEELAQQQSERATAIPAPARQAPAATPPTPTELVQYMTEPQRAEILELLKVDLIEKGEYTKTMEALPRLTEGQARGTIAKLKKLISERAGGVQV